MRNIVFVSIFSLLAGVAAALESLPDDELDDIQARAGIMLDIEWRLDADENGNTIGANSIPVQLSGQEGWLIFHNNTGLLKASGIEISLSETTTEMGPSVPAMKLRLGDGLILKNWRIAEVSVGSAPDSLPGENGMIVNFETNAHWRLGQETTVWMFSYDPP